MSWTLWLPLLAQGLALSWLLWLVQRVLGLATPARHLLLCDGTVRFVGENIDLALWRGISTRAGGEILGEF